MSGYRNCRWCQGQGCISCDAEADRDYKKQFPNGAQPIATFKIGPGETGIDVLKKLLGTEALVAAGNEARGRAEKFCNEHKVAVAIAGDVAGISPARAHRCAVEALSHQMIGDVLTENIKKAAADEEAIEL